MGLVYLNHLEMRQAVLEEESKEVTAVGAEYSYQDSLQCEWVIFMKVP
jgi:hypothetical protein